MKDVDLLAVVLDLRPYLEEPVRATNWYGRAVQAEVYGCINYYDKDYGASLHRLNEEKKPFTASTLIGRFPNRKIRSDDLYSLRITGLNHKIEEILYQAIQPGGFWGIGSLLHITGIPFVVESIFWDNRDHRLACHTNYLALKDSFIEQKTPRFKKIKFDFQKCPVLNQDGDIFNPIITPRYIFESLMRKWNNLSSIFIDKSILEFLDGGIFVSGFRLESQPVQQEGLVMGGKGFIEVSTKYHDDERWAYLQMLAAFSFYSGIGKNTTRGFGQMIVEFS